MRVQRLSQPNASGSEIPASLHGRWEQKTNAQGECVFPGLPQGMTAQFAAQSDAFAALTYQDNVTLGRSATQRAAPIHLARAGTVQGQVTNAVDGANVAGVHLLAQGVGISAGWGQTFTDTQGRYRLTGLLPGAYNIMVLLREPMQPSDSHEESLTARALEKVDVRPGATLSHQDIALIKGSLLTGRVTDKVTGKPVANAAVGVYGPAFPRSGAAVQGGKTDADGVYRQRVPAGKQYVYIMGVIDPPADRYERPANGMYVDVKENTDATQDFALMPIPARNLESIHGLVVDANGAPVPNATLNVVPVTGEPFAMFVQDAKSDAKGAFSVMMRTASVRLRARAGRMATETTTLAQSGDRVILRLKPDALVALKGQVTDERNRPLEGAKVTLVEWRLDTGMGNVHATTDVQGRFAFPNLYPDARYSIGAEASGYGSRNSSVTQYQPGATGQIAAFQLPRADSFVAGRVVDESGDPVAKQSVRLQGETNKYQETITDGQGRFRFEGVVNEPLQLYLYDAGTGFSSSKKAKARDTDVIFVRKAAMPTPASKAAANDQAQEDAAGKRRSGLLAQPAPPLNTTAWLNTKAKMPEELKGKIVLLDFWTVSCGPCVAALPAVQQISEQYAGWGVVVVGLHGSEANTELIASFVRAHHLTYPIAIDADDPTHQTFGQTMRAFGVVGIPTVAVLDRQGVVRYLDSGLEGAVKVIADLLASEK